MPSLESLHPLVSFAIAIFGLSVAPNSKSVRYACGLALIAYGVYSIYRPYPPTTPKFQVYLSALQPALNVIFYFDHAIINNAHITYKRKGQILPYTQMPFFQRLKWSIDLMSANRGVHWSWEIPYLHRSTQSRWLFVRQKLFHVLAGILASDILRFLRFVSPAWEVGGEEGFGSRGLMWQIYNVAIFWLSTASMQVWAFSFWSMVTVALGICDPGDWPSLYGRWSDARSVRTFWGRTWHQLLRQPLKAHGRFFTIKVLGLDPKSNLSSYIELYIAFLISGTCHATGDWVVSKVFRDGWSSIIFYLSQAVIITIEDGLIAFGRVVGIRRLPSIVGYTWVVFWMVVLVPIWVESMAKRGIDLEAPISILSPSKIRALIS